MKTAKWVGLLGLGVALGCASPDDVPSRVSDLRVLGMQLEPPERMADACPDFSNPQDLEGQDVLAFLGQISGDLELRALVLDPAGEGRPVRWDLYACADPSLSTCTGVDRIALASGEDPGGEWTATVTNLAGRFNAENVPLLQRVLEEDTFRGLGGVRVPLYLHVRAGEEEIWARKLMVYSCPFFPTHDPPMTANVNPALPELLLNGEPWTEDAVPTLFGAGPFEVEPVDFTDREETYVVPSFELQPVVLEESWMIAWHTDFGRFSPNETGGADFGGGKPRHLAEWTPPQQGEGREVRFWMVVRDGRGGMSWVMRRANYER